MNPMWLFDSAVPQDLQRPQRLKSSEVYNPFLVDEIVKNGDLYLLYKPTRLIYRIQWGERKDVTIGRIDLRTMQRPDIDLAIVNAIKYGVSRKHAQIKWHNATFYIVDTYSSNRTFVNAQVTLPARPCKLRDGDVIRLGRLLLHVFL